MAVDYSGKKSYNIDPWKQVKDILTKLISWIQDILSSLGYALSNPLIKIFFMQLAFNLSNGVTDTLESSTILLNPRKHMGLYTQNVDRTPHLLNVWLKVNKKGEAGTMN